MEARRQQHHYGRGTANPERLKTIYNTCLRGTFNHLELILNKKMQMNLLDSVAVNRPKAKSPAPTGALSSKPRYAELFAGIGGLGEGFKRHGAQVVYANEYDKFCSHHL